MSTPQTGGVKPTLPERVRMVRKRMSLTQDEYADRLGVTKTTVSRWEQGRVEPGVESLKAMAREGSVSLAWLLTGEEDELAADPDAHLNASLREWLKGNDVTPRVRGWLATLTPPREMPSDEFWTLVSAAALTDNTLEKAEAEAGARFTHHLRNKADE